MKYGTYVTIGSLLLIMVGLHARMTREGNNNNQQRLSTLKAGIAQIDDELGELYGKIAELRSQRDKLIKEQKSIENLIDRS